MAEKSSEHRYALVGHPVSHSHSPVIHGLFAQQTGQDIAYELIDAEEDEFDIAVFGFRAAGGKGLNVTVPHKERAVELATQRSSAVEKAGASNTLTFSGGAIIADNTDGIGLVRDLTVNLEIDLDEKRVLILGAGGAVRGIICPLFEAGIGSLTVANRTRVRAENLQSSLNAHASFEICAFDDLDSLDPPDLIFNATSAGINGERIPFPASLFGRHSVCYDLSYSLKSTPFVDFAKQHGAAQAFQGWGMLVEQAAESFKIWRGVRPDTLPILEKLVR